MLNWIAVLELLFITVDVPLLKPLVSGEMSFDQRYKFLAFITVNIIDEENLKKIPVEYLGHVIVLVHLISNDSLQVFEAIAFTKVLKDIYEEKIPSAIIYPKTIDVRALRTSFLYAKMYYVLSRCMSTVGLKKLVVSCFKHKSKLRSIWFLFTDRNRNG